MSCFLGIGFGPIQTGIFLEGAFKGGFDRIVVAEVNPSLVAAIRNSKGHVSINVASKDSVCVSRMERIEAFNPADPADLAQLIKAAAEADEICTALPGVKFFKDVAQWLRKGFALYPQRRRFIYTAENHNHAAELLKEAVSLDLPDTHYLNTVVGKMSGVVPADECKARNLKTLCDGADRGHLVEEFNRILIGSAPGIETRKTQGLIVKPDLLPFEEAKLYGHNAIHLLLGLLAQTRGLRFMHEIASSQNDMAFARAAFVEESGAALCKKWAGVDSLFTKEGYADYADDLLERMTNPFLADAIERVCRDMERKLGWDDRLVGTIRICLSQGVEPSRIAKVAAKAALDFLGSAQGVEDGLRKIWQQPWDDEHSKVLDLLCRKV